MTTRTCSVPRCDRPHEAKGLCHAHYTTWKRTGVMPTGPVVKDKTTMFWAKVNKTPLCWLWEGATDGGGRYGSFLYDGKVRRAHRVSLALAGIEVPEGMDVDHLCRVTLCVRPDHLEVVSHRTNVMRGESLQATNARKTHCPRGHEYDLTLKGGARWCRVCQREANREAQRRYRARKRAERT